MSRWYIRLTLTLVTISRAGIVVRCSDVALLNYSLMNQTVDGEGGNLRAISWQLSKVGCVGILYHWHCQPIGRVVDSVIIT